MPKQKQKRQVDLLLVGHVTRDLIGETPRSGWRLGGTVSFAAITALRLGRKPTIITRAAQASDLGELPNEVERIVLPAANTTTFVPGGNLNDGVNSVQARSADDRISLRLTCTKHRQMLRRTKPQIMLS